jgi:hypothetical protein
MIIIVAIHQIRKSLVNNSENKTKFDVCNYVFLTTQFLYDESFWLAVISTRKPTPARRFLCFQHAVFIINNTHNKKKESVRV